MGDRTEYFLKPLFSRPELFYLLIGLIPVFFLILIFCFLDWSKDKAGESMLIRHSAALLTLLSLVLFFSEALYSASAFFYSDWDPAGILDCVYKLLRNRSGEISLDYFSAHPNNLMLVCIYLAVLRIASLFGTETVISLVLFQSLLFTLGGVLFFYIIKDLLSVRAAFIAWLLYAVWIGFNPYLLITYSDAVGLIFPLILLRLFQLILMRGREGSGLLYVLFAAFIGALGYAVKPQTVIVFIAGIIILFLITILGRDIRLLFKPLAALAFFLITSFTVTSLIYPSLGLKLDRDKSFGFSHYIMMGLNPETDGVYSNEDTEFTNSIKDPVKRREENLRVTFERIEAYGFTGLLGHLKRKELINFSDGSFSWGIDGNFFAGPELGDLPKVREDSPLRPFIHSFIIAGGENYGRFRDILQVFWLTVLFFTAAGEIFVLKRLIKGGTDRSPVIMTASVLFLSLYGLSLFELIFEAKARYLFTYLPLFLTAGVFGAYRIYRSLRHCLKK